LDAGTHLIELAVVASDESTELRIGILQDWKPRFIPKPWICACILIIIPKREVMITAVRFPLYSVFVWLERRGFVEKALKAEKISHSINVSAKVCF
jgi:hypothetical protein